MKTKPCIIVLTALALTGCASNFRLPNIEGESVSYTRTDPLGGTHIDATGVKVTESHVTAETANFTTTYPAFNVDVRIKGYKRKRVKEDEK